jgi:hypothetical protein
MLQSTLAALLSLTCTLAMAEEVVLVEAESF